MILTLFFFLGEVSVLSRGTGTAASKQSMFPPIDAKEKSIISQQGLDLAEIDDEDDTTMYFQSIDEVLDLFSELEERNLSQITNSQDIEEQLDDVKRTIRDTTAQKEKETATLKAQIERLQKQIVKEREKAKDLETRIKFFSYGDIEEHEQDKILEDLQSKVLEVYRVCIGDIDAQIR